MHRYSMTLAVAAAVALAAPMAAQAATGSGFSALGFHTAMAPAPKTATTTTPGAASGDANGDAAGFKSCTIGKHINSTRASCGGGAKAAETAAGGGSGLGKASVQDLHKQGGGTMALQGDARSATTAPQPGAGPQAIADQLNSGTLISYKASAKASTPGGTANPGAAALKTKAKPGDPKK